MDDKDDAAARKIVELIITSTWIRTKIRLRQSRLRMFILHSFEHTFLWIVPLFFTRIEQTSHWLNCRAFRGVLSTFSNVDCRKTLYSECSCVIVSLQTDLRCHAKRTLNDATFTYTSHPYTKEACPSVYVCKSKREQQALHVDDRWRLFILSTLKRRTRQRTFSFFRIIIFYSLGHSQKYSVLLFQFNLKYRRQCSKFTSNRKKIIYDTICRFKFDSIM